MKEDLITFETAKLSKEKGFNDPTIHWYHIHTKKLNSNDLLFSMNRLTNNYAAPTQTSLQKWLWETHKIWVEIYLVIDRRFSFYIKNEEGKIIKIQNEKSKDCKNPYIIFEEGLQEALKLI